MTLKQHSSNGGCKGKTQEINELCASLDNYDVVCKAAKQRAHLYKKQPPSPPAGMTENGNPAYAWYTASRMGSDLSEKEIQEAFVSLYFQLTLSYNSSQNIALQGAYEELLRATQGTPYFDYVIRLAMQTRDIDQGKGLYGLGCYMIESLCYASYAKHWISNTKLFTILERWFHEFQLVDGSSSSSSSASSSCSTKTEMPYGSWKDLKNFLNYFMHDTKHHYFAWDYYERRDITDELIERFYVTQMVRDRKNMSLNQRVSLCGKWLPRERHSSASTNGDWLANAIAKAYYKHVFQVSAKESHIMSVYRKLCSELNRYIDTVQVHMCEKKWDQINFEHVTSQSLFKFKSAFLNKKEVPELHRYVCRDNLNAYVASKTASKNGINAKTLLPHQCVQECLRLKELETKQSDDEKCIMLKESIDLLNLQWESLVEHINGRNSNHVLANAIPCIDVSPSMYNHDPLPLYSAIGMGLLATEVSNVKRAFTFSAEPDWISIPDSMTFYQKVSRVRRSKWGATTNVYKMFEHILDTCLASNVSNYEVGNYTLFVFSDMQFDECSQDGERDIIESARNLFFKKGAYTNIPHIIFWNLRTTNTLPVIEQTPFSTRLSGNSASLFKYFLLPSTRLDDIKNMSSWTLIRNMLDNPRYTSFTK